MSGTVVDKFAFPGDSRSTLGTGLTTATRGMGGAAETGGAGYFAGGTTGVVVDTVEKFAFPGDGRTTLGTGLSSARNDGAGAANSGTL